MHTVPDGQCFGWDILSHLCCAAVSHVHTSNICTFLPMTGFRIDIIEPVNVSSRRIQIELHMTVLRLATGWCVCVTTHASQRNDQDIRANKIRKQMEMGCPQTFYACVCIKTK